MGSIVIRIVSAVTFEYKNGVVSYILNCYGAGEEIRTLDVLLGKQTLYQLSYTRLNGNDVIFSVW